MSSSLEIRSKIICTIHGRDWLTGGPISKDLVLISSTVKALVLISQIQFTYTFLLPFLSSTQSARLLPGRELDVGLEVVHWRVVLGVLGNRVVNPGR